MLSSPQPTFGERAQGSGIAYPTSSAGSRGLRRSVRGRHEDLRRVARHVVGEPRVALHVAGTGSRYRVNAHLFDVSPTNEPTLLAVGTATTDLSPTTLTIPLSVTGRRIPAGHRLRLEITNRDDQDIDPTDGHTPESGALRYIPFLEFSSNTVFFDVARPSCVEIPLVGSAVLPIAPPVPSFSMWGMVFLGLGMTGVAVRHAR